jgi:hypothetical protein
MQIIDDGLAQRTIAGWGDGWRPIEAAPRDGTPILGFVESSKGPASGVMYVVWWREGHDGRWCFFESGRGESYSVYPTLWQPLPRMPTPSASRPAAGTR